MLSPSHILETALLILLAFLAGCVIGYVARRLMMPGGVTATATALPASAVKAGGPPLVVAPTIAPVAGARARRTPAGRLAAAAGRSPGPEEPIAASVPDEHPAAPLPPAGQASATILSMMGSSAAASAVPAPTPEVPVEATAETPAGSAIEPAHVAGEAVTIVAPPTEQAAPEVVPEHPVEPVAAKDVPPIDEATHVLEPESETSVAAPATLLAEPVPEPVPPVESEPAPAAVEDPEAAAMRAIEGGWTPPRRTSPQRGPVPHPDLAGADVDLAMANARSAVAAATAAATAVIAEQSAPASEPPSFEPASESVAQNFLEETASPRDDGGLNFEPARPQQGFGRPESLPAPRGGAKDDLTRIKGVSAQLEQSLNGLGIFHLDQIAAWDQKAIVWLDRHLALKGRIGREKWIDQARTLAQRPGLTARPVRR